jgi:pyruvate/2-oxoglutarate dehydrogenase complex dihydrolipoamide dehydrogenase (E3) component
VNGSSLRFNKAVIATGTRPAVPDIPGLLAAGFLTSETVFSLTELPRKLIVIGGGPIGCELAQAFRRFGSEVTLLLRGDRLLPREDSDASALLHRQFQSEGIGIEARADIVRVERRDTARVVVFGRAGREEETAGDEILIAAGRRPNTEHLKLDVAGVEFDDEGVEVDDRLRTSNRRVHAAGDVGSRYRFTHAADALARIALQNALFFGRKRASALVIPWCTYTSPEVAHVGVSDHEARKRGLTTYTIPLSEVDRAILDGEEDGFALIHVTSSGRIAGATLVATRAGDMIGEIALAMTADISFATLARTIHPYPTQAEVWKKLGDAWSFSRLTPFWRRVLERWFGLRR